MKSLLHTAALALVLQAPGIAMAASPLEGKVSSAQEPVMEGVLVSAKLKGSNMTTTVVSDDNGHYAFPDGRLKPGQYDITIRAANYELPPTTAQIAAGKPTTLDIALKKAVDPSTQLSNAEWMESVPGTEKQRQYMEDCVDCHTLERVFKSTHTSAEFMEVFDKMATFMPGSVPGHPQTVNGAAFRRSGTAAAKKSQADFLASVNLSGDREDFRYQFKRLPRPKGRATRVVITEWDLPREESHPHDVMLDKAGNAWYADFSSQYIGMLDPKTGKVTDYKLPEPKPGAPTGALDLEADKDGNFWVSMQHQTGLVKFDTRTKKITHYPVPDEWQTLRTQQAFVAPEYAHIDGKVWTSNQDQRTILRLDIKTGKYEDFGKYIDANGEQLGTYGIPADKNNNLYLLEFRQLVKGDASVGGSSIGFIDGKTKEYTVYPTPTPEARPRRGRVDSENRLWFAEYRGNAIGMFDPKTKEIKEWKLPTKWSGPYDVMMDKTGAAWTASMMTDQVDRLDPKTGTWVEYLLPRQSNIRRVWVDDTQARPPLWIGSVHGGSIIRLEPLD